MPRWMILALVVILLVAFWGTLAAAAPPAAPLTEKPTPTPVEGMIAPSDASSTMIVGAILMIAVIITGTIIRALNRS